MGVLLGCVDEVFEEVGFVDDVGCCVKVFLMGMV